MQDISAACTWFVISTNGIAISLHNEMVSFAADWVSTPTLNKTDQREPSVIEIYYLQKTKKNWILHFLLIGNLWHTGPSERQIGP